MGRVAAVLLVVLLAGRASADPADDLRRLVREADGSADAVIGLLRGLASLPDCDLDAAQVRHALQDIRPGVVADLLRPVRRLTKRGDRVLLERAEDTKLTNAKGVTIAMARKVTLRVRVDGPHDAMIDRIEGIRGGKGLMLDVNKVQFTREGGKPVAKVGAGWFTFTVEIKPKRPEPSAGLAAAVATT